MSKSSILDKRILFNTGKGGVGKTTVSAALAYAARDQGKNVCLVEVGESPNLRYIFEREIPVYREFPVDRGLTVLTIEPFQALHEYVALQLKVASAAKMILNNRIIQYFMQAAPGWRELITVGKIWHLQDQTQGWNKKPVYDTIIVDAPATGHGLSFLRVPSVFMNILKFGRMQGQTFDVQAMLTDSNRTAINVVTLAEEMPVNEAITVLSTAKDVLNMQTGVTFVNCLYPELFSKDQEARFAAMQEDSSAMRKLSAAFEDHGAALLAVANEQNARSAQSQYYLNLVKEKASTPVVTLPYLYPGRVDRNGIKELAKILGEALGGVE